MFGRTFLRQIANSRRSPEHQWDFVKIVVSMFRGVHSPCVSRNEAVQQTKRIGQAIPPNTSRHTRCQPRLLSSRTMDDIR